MKDISTEKPLYVSTEGTGGPYIMVPITQVLDVRGLLDENEISYSVDEDAVSLNRKPAITVINLGRGGDAAIVQAILDKAS